MLVRYRQRSTQRRGEAELSADVPIELLAEDRPRLRADEYPQERLLPDRTVPAHAETPGLCRELPYDLPPRRPDRRSQRSQPVPKPRRSARRTVAAGARRQRVRTLRS